MEKDPKFVSDKTIIKSYWIEEGHEDTTKGVPNNPRADVSMRVLVGPVVEDVFLTIRYEGCQDGPSSRGAYIQLVARKFTF